MLQKKGTLPRTTVAKPRSQIFAGSQALVFALHRHRYNRRVIFRMEKSWLQKIGKKTLRDFIAVRLLSQSARIRTFPRIDGSLVQTVS